MIKTNLLVVVDKKIDGTQFEDKKRSNDIPCCFTSKSTLWVVKTQALFILEFVQSLRFNDILCCLSVCGGMVFAWCSRKLTKVSKQCSSATNCNIEKFFSTAKHIFSQKPYLSVLNKNHRKRQTMRYVGVMHAAFLTYVDCKSAFLIYLKLFQLCDMKLLQTSQNFPVLQVQPV